MNKEEIIRQINDCKNKISNNNSKIGILEEKIYELEKVTVKLDETEDKLNAHYYKNINRFDRMGSTFSNMKFAVQCAQEMKEVVGGAGYRKALQGIQSSMDVTRTEINQKQNRIEDIQRENSNLNMKLQDLETKLAQARMEEMLL